MRAFLIVLCVAGFGLVLGAFVMAVDTAVTDDHRAAVQETIAERAEANEEMSRREGRADVFGRLARLYTTFANGIFRNLPIAAADILPPPAAGWTSRPYAIADAEALSGRPLHTGPLASTTENTIFKRFAEATEGKTSVAAATYGNGTHVILLAAHVSQQAFRAADDGTVDRAPPVSAPFATVAGVPVRTERTLHTHLLDNTTFSADYRHLTIDLDGFILIEILTDAPDGDVLALLSGLQMDALQDILPVTTDGYLPQTAAALADTAATEAASGG